MSNSYKPNFNNQEFNRGGNKPPKKPEKKKINFKTLKKNTIHSLNEVECFLNDFHRFCNYVKLYKILK